jgi:FtsP/CotA-like multicopper oxidase with cupredoxin domain
MLPMRPDGRGADRGAAPLNPDDPRNQLLQIRVTKPLSGPDNSRIPNGFRPYPLPLPLPNEAVATKTFDFKRSGGGWVIDVDGKGGVPWDPDADHTPEMLKNPANQVKKNTAEIWRLKNSSGGWEHPIHVHFEEGMIVKSHGVAQPVRARQDVYRMGNGTDVEVFLRFRDYPQPGFTAAPPVPVGEKPGNDLPPIKNDAAKHDVNAGRYVMHCHNVVHEDHAMMTSWSIIDRSAGAAATTAAATTTASASAKRTSSR